MNFRGRAKALGGNSFALVGFWLKPEPVKEMRMRGGKVDADLYGCRLGTMGGFGVSGYKEGERGGGALEVAAGAGDGLVGGGFGSFAHDGMGFCDCRTTPFQLMDAPFSFQPAKMSICGFSIGEREEEAGRLATCLCRPRGGGWFLPLRGFL